MTKNLKKLQKINEELKESRQNKVSIFARYLVKPHHIQENYKSAEKIK